MDTAVTIVIPVWNAVQTTKNCLHFLRDTVRPGDQVVVVNNGSRDGTAEFLGTQDWIEVVTHEENLGFAGGCNAGARQARHPIIVFLNNDTLPTPGWIDGLIAPFTDVTVGATGPMSNFVSGPQLLLDPRYEPKNIADIAAHADALRARAAGQSQEVRRLVGFCLAVRTIAFGEIGGFDERFGVGGYEDDDLCLRLALAGWRMLIARDTFVHHIGHQTFDANAIDWHGLQTENKTKLTAKLDNAPPVSFLVLCGEEAMAVVATLVGIDQTVGDRPFEVLLLVPDPAPIAEVLEGVRGVVVVDVAGLSEEDAWRRGNNVAKGLRRATIRAGEAVDMSSVYRLLESAPLATRPVPVGTALTD